jgi:hypothetical protein
MMKSVSQFLYTGNNWRTITCSVLLSLIFLSYIPLIASLFHLDFYLLVDRVIYLNQFKNDSVFTTFGVVFTSILFSLWIFFSMESKSGRIASFIVGSLILGGILLSQLLSSGLLLLQLISIFSLPFIVVLIAGKAIIREDFGLWTKNRLAMNYLAILGCCLAMTSIYLSISRSVPISVDATANPWLLFYLTFSYLAPIMMFLCMFSVPINIVLRSILQRLRLANLTHLDLVSSQHYSIQFRYIIIFMALAIVVVSIPHFNPAREDHPNVSVDIIYYQEWLAKLQNSSDLNELLTHLFVELSGGDRSLTLLLMMPFANINPELTSQIIQIVMPTVLAPSLVLIIFFLTLELTRNPHLSLISSFLTVFSFQVLGGTYSGYYANWVGLIVMYLSLYSLIKYLRGHKTRLMLVSYVALAIVLMFVHSYTWSILIIFTSVFVIVLYFKRLINRRTIVTILIVLVILLVFDLAKGSLGLGRGAIGNNFFTIDRTGTGTEQIELRWSNLVRTVQVYIGGIYSNIFVLSTAFLGSILLYQKRLYGGIFVLVFMSLGVLPLFFGDREIIARFFYDIPFQIPAAVALYWFHRQGLVGTIIMISIIISIVAGSINITTNI